REPIGSCGDAARVNESDRQTDGHASGDETADLDLAGRIDLIVIIVRTGRIDVIIIVRTGVVIIGPGLVDPGLLAADLIVATVVECPAVVRLTAARDVLRDTYSVANSDK